MIRVFKPFVCEVTAMSLVKNIILYPATKLESYVMTDGEFNSKGRSLAQFVVVLSVVMLIADPILAMVRYGNFVLQDAWFYAVSIVCVGLIAMVARPGSEKSIKEMRYSSNILVKGLIYTLFGLVVAFEFVAKLLLPLIERFASGVAKASASAETEHEELDWMAKSRKANDYMMDVSNDPPTHTW